MVRALAASFAPHAWVNVHSGMEALFMPYDHRTVIPTGAPTSQQVQGCRFSLLRSNPGLWSPHWCST